MKKHVRITASLSLILVLCSVFAAAPAKSNKNAEASTIARDWDPGESKPIVTL